MLTAEKLELVPAPAPEIMLHVPGSELTGPALRAWLGHPGEQPGDCPLLPLVELADGFGQDEGRQP